MSKAPLLFKPLPSEGLIIYLSVSATTVISVLIRKFDGLEYLVYYVSKVFQDIKLQNHDLKKLTLALIISAPKI